jgi:hypothetical protein
MDGIFLLEHVRPCRLISTFHHHHLHTHAACNRLNIALELAKHNAVYEDIASKFFEVLRTGFPFFL